MAERLGASTSDHVLGESLSEDAFLREKKCYFNVFKKYLFIFERERESECACMSGGGAEREGERKSQAGFALSAQTLARGSIS